ncbi:tetratricopeptide repeat protein [Streptomyces spectabilis]|uniref:tetratricopeptide repeat protein n=1 Tax=Streptomyces spectabilis TaxID=68270 RepID=UPI0034080850
MSTEPVIGWIPQYQGVDSSCDVVHCYEQFVSSKDPQHLTALKSLAMADRSGGNLHALASAYLVAGQPAQAIPLLEFLADVAPAELAPRCDLATAYIQIGNAQRAARELERVLEASAGLPAAVRQLAELQDWLRWRDTEVDFQRRRADYLSERLGGQTVGVDEYVMLARALYSLAKTPGSGVDWPDVLDVLEPARQLDSAHVQVLELLVGATSFAGAESAWHDALLELERVAPQSPILGHARSMPHAVRTDPCQLLAVACSGTEDAYSALCVLRGHYRMAPNNRDVQWCLMQAEVAQGSLAEALWLAEGLADTVGLNFDERCALALLYGVARKQPQAAQHYAAALALAPDPEARAAIQADYDSVCAP